MAEANERLLGVNSRLARVRQLVPLNGHCADDHFIFHFVMFPNAPHSSPSYGIHHINFYHLNITGRSIAPTWQQTIS